MAVNRHRQCTTVFMAQPTTHRWNIDAGLDACRGEQMPQVMVSIPGDAKPTASGFHGHILNVDAAHELELSFPPGTHSVDHRDFHGRRVITQAVPSADTGKSRRNGERRLYIRFVYGLRFLRHKAAKRGKPRK